jgi:hypothetical protein
MSFLKSTNDKIKGGAGYEGREHLVGHRRVQ